ncbi:MAG: hypothetical protein Q8L92_00810 [Rubrivivax sp.]|nr:hypothetical protein [Rubrivivax sp.]
MSVYWKRSRITKVLADAARVGSFSEAAARLDSIQLDVVVGDDQLGTPAGQAAALTAVATARKCFGRVTIVAERDAPLIATLPLGKTLLKAARRLGARVATRPRTGATHTIRIGSTPTPAGWNLSCWWDRWLAGTRAFDDGPGDSRLALAGVFAGALAVRQVFACVVANRNVPPRDATVSLWTPWERVDCSVNGPERFDVPDKLWLLGLGHLGQSFVWNLCLLGGNGDRLAVLQDDQKIGVENEATSLLVLPHGRQIGKKKTKVADPWLEASGWRTQLVERRHLGDVAITDEDPPYLLSGLDRLEPRLTLARHGFPYMLDAGIGHGPGDFEGIQIRTIAKGQPIEGLWDKPKTADESTRNGLLSRQAYLELERHVGQCGTVEFAEASVAVPFVGAAAGALVIAQAIRLASLEPAPVFVQMELGAPEMTTLGGLIAQPEINLGSFSVRLEDRTPRPSIEHIREAPAGGGA